MESAIIFVIPLLMMGAGTSGSNELLDFMQTQAYWNSRGVEVSVDKLLSQITTVEKPQDIGALIKQLGDADFDKREAATDAIARLGPSVVPQLEGATGSDDAEVADRARRLIKLLSGGENDPLVNKLMVIRTLGELKDEKALPALEKLSESGEPFVADHARRAIAMIKGEKYKPPQPDAATLDKDVWLLPKGCKTVAQMTVGGGDMFPYDKAFEQLGALGLVGQNKDQLIAQMNQGVLTALNMIGNVRADSMTVGLSGDPGPNSGWVVAIIRGKYDTKRVRDAFAEYGAQLSEQQGVTIASPDPHVNFLIVSETTLVMIGGANNAQFPINETLTALKAGKGTLAEDETMAKLVGSIKDRSRGAWGVMQMTDTYRQLEWLAPYDTLTLERHVTDKTIGFTITCAGSDAEKVTATVAGFKEDMDELRKEMKNMQGMLPKALFDFAESIKVRQEGATATVTGAMPAGPDAVMGGAMLPWFFLMSRAF